MNWAGPPRASATDAIAKLVGGMRDGADDVSRPAAGTSGPAPVAKVLTGIGQRP